MTPEQMKAAALSGVQQQAARIVQLNVAARIYANMLELNCDPENWPEEPGALQQDEKLARWAWQRAGLLMRAANLG